MKKITYSYSYIVIIYLSILLFGNGRIYAQTFYCEDDGVLVVEAEAEDPCEGIDPQFCGWFQGTIKDTLIDTVALKPFNGFEGDGFLVWNVDCDTSENVNDYGGCEGIAPPEFSQPIRYNVHFETPGIYRFIIRTWQPNIGYDGIFDGPSSLNNDLWVRFIGGTGFNVKKQEDPIPDDTVFVEEEFFKMFQAQPNKWTWDTFGDAEFIGEEVNWQIDSAGNYAVEIGGRSFLFGFDKFALYHTDLSFKGEATSAPSSETNCEEAFTWFEDSDGDGFGNDNVIGEPGDGFVLVGGDCDDNNPNINPGESEITGNDIDENCNGVLDEVGPIAGMTLMNADTDKPIQELKNGDVISFDNLTTENLNIVVDVVEDVGSIKFNMTGTQNHLYYENGAPYTAFGDNGQGDFFAWNFLNGPYKLIATAYSGFDTTGNIIGELEVNFEFTGTLLPVELLSFEATANDKSVVLNWITASETDHASFGIERSSNGREFVLLGQLAGQGTTTEPSEYSFNDNNPLIGKAFYRLKEIDINGGVTYSPTIEVSFEGLNTDMSFYPNPLNQGEDLKISVSSSLRGTLTIKLFDVVGKVSKVFDLKEIQNGIATVPMNGLNPGIYILQVQHGNKEQVFKLLIN